MIRFRDLLIEGALENAALDYLKQIVRSGPYRGKVFLAGGAVRDIQLGTDPKDLDVVVTGDINSGIEFATWATKYMGNYSEGSNPTVFPTFGTAKFTLRGIQHNGFDLSNIDIEAVAARSETYSDDSRKPTVTGASLSDDAYRRDLTLNSLMLDLTNDELLDLTGLGKDDLAKGLVRTPIDPNITFNEDPLRMLRAIRFTFKYDWDLPIHMIRALKANAPKLKKISAERIRDELNKILVTGSPDRAMKLLRITGLLNYIIPEFQAAVKMTQNAHHTQDVFGHTLDVLKSTQPVIAQRLMALFHDIGKTATRSVTPSGVHFFGHESVGADMTREIMRRLKYPTEITNAVADGVAHHMKLKHGGDDAVKLSDKTLRKFKIALGDKLEDVLNVIHADNTAHSEASSMPNQIDNVRERLKGLEASTPSAPKLPISGKDLIDMGIKPGPIFSKILDAITEKWYENPDITKEQALHIAKSIANSQPK